MSSVYIEDRNMVKFTTSFRCVSLYVVVFSYRVLQHAFDMQAVSSVNVKATARRSKHFSETDRFVTYIIIRGTIKGCNIYNCSYYV